MHALDVMAIALVAATALWGFLKLQERISFLEHEVRWIRNELELLKPREVESAYDLT
jgi:hypothetical protein